MDDAIVGKGYAEAASTLNVFGNNCNDLLAAETMMMVKERFIEAFGKPLFTMGQGASGGSYQQLQIADNYPGLLDGILPGATFPDILATVQALSDMELLRQNLRLVRDPGTEPRLRAIGCETIYAFIYRTGQKAEALWRYLTRRHKRRRPRRARASRDTIKDRASIHDRPKTIESRGEAGHWEGDLIICNCTRPVLVLHERKSRVTLAARLTGKTAAETISAMLAVFGRIDPHLRRSITFDNDTAFAQHGLLRTMRDMTTWFCDAYASWQKGGVENANGRLRRWLPRHLDIDRTSDQDIQEIVLTTNLTPRKCLGFKTPFQALLCRA